MKLITLLSLYIDELQETQLNDSDDISLNQSISSSPTKCHRSSSRLFNTVPSIDESLHDEDAWMSILDVVHAEVFIYQC